MVYYKKEVGKQGEDEAARYLRENGYEITDRNFRTRFGEIDIVALENKDIVFVEVKKRNNSSFGTAQAAVDFRKQGKLVKMAFQYIKSKNCGGANFRFDVLAISNGNIELIKNAFSARRGSYY
ncbi:MAG: YraN family protein [Elusimicrobia bacterium RIFOXYB2_FULL_48_7]|nr:MAG: YraN family protein [Elusimicrobia bacterium RIFOXYB2_FULL_48_7]